VADGARCDGAPRLNPIGVASSRLAAAHSAPSITAIRRPGEAGALLLPPSVADPRSLTEDVSAVIRDIAGWSIGV